jgi:hypothetical protein
MDKEGAPKCADALNAIATALQEFLINECTGTGGLAHHASVLENSAQVPIARVVMR